MFLLSADGEKCLACDCEPTVKENKGNSELTQFYEHLIRGSKLFQITWKWATIKTFEHLPRPKGMWPTVSR